MRGTVLHLADYGGEYSGNFVSSLRALRAPAAEAGLDLCLGFSDLAVSRQWLSDLRRDDFRVEILPRTMNAMRLAGRVRELVRRERTVVVHTHFTTYDIPAALAAVSEPDRRPRVFWHIHSSLGESRSGLLRRLKDHVKLRRLGSRVRPVAVSAHLLDQAERYGLPRGRGSVVHNGVDLGRLTPTAPREQIRLELGIEPNRQVALMFGCDPHRKGVDIAVEAGRRLAEGRPLTLLIVGGDELVRYLAHRRAQAPWLKTTAPRERVADLYSAADVFLSPSRAEGFPYSMCEAMGMGLPLVVSRLPGQEWALGVDGVLGFDVGDAAGLAAAVVKALETAPAERERRASALRTYARDSLSVESWARTIVDLYTREA